MYLLSTWLYLFDYNHHRVLVKVGISFNSVCLANAFSENIFQIKISHCAVSVVVDTWK